METVEWEQRTGVAKLNQSCDVIIFPFGNRVLALTPAPAFERIYIYINTPCTFTKLGEFAEFVAAFCFVAAGVLATMLACDFTKTL